MKLRTSLAAAGAAVVLGTTGASVLPAVATAQSGPQRRMTGCRKRSHPAVLPP